MSSYRCFWKRTESGYEMHMAEHPEIKAHAATFQRARKVLWDAVFKFKDDWEPDIQLWPPPPIATRHRHFTGDWLLLGGGEAIRATEPMAALFSDGICPVCHCGRGERNAVPLAFKFEENEECEIGTVRGDVANMRTRTRVVSAELVSAFLEKGLVGSELLPCRNTGKPSKKEYFEVRPNNPVKPVPIEHLRAEIIECKTCQRRGIPPYDPVPGISFFALKTDLDAIRSSWTFMVGSLASYYIVVRADRVDPDKLRTDLKGVSFSWLGTAKESDVFRNVPVRVLTGK